MTARMQAPGYFILTTTLDGPPRRAWKMIEFCEREEL